jgi:hypothetical protein
MAPGLAKRDVNVEAAHDGIILIKIHSLKKTGWRKAEGGWSKAKNVAPSSLLPPISENWHESCYLKNGIVV